ncbi:MAG: RimK family alpha-L-glutamate ligase [Myxococcales bacterium]|nr:RimK family alpha-L-glutamate ligase [Myxococcales bacterium]
MSRVRHERLCILSRQKSLYSTARLVDAAEALDASPIVIDTLRCTMVIGPDGSQLLYRGVSVEGLSAVIPRIGTSITNYGMQVVNHLDSMGVPVVNSATAIARSRDKVRCLQVLAAGGVGVPRTVMANDTAHIVRLVDAVGGLPCIIKLLRGTQGVGVMIATTMTEARTIVDTFTSLGQEICLQEFIAESSGRDVRALVVGDRVVGAMRRQARAGEFRSNIHRGGEGSPVTLEPAFLETAVKAAKLVGLDICGVDMLEGKDGPRVMELNSSPGFEGLEHATGQDVASEMVRFALDRAAAARNS